MYGPGPGVPPPPQRPAGGGAVIALRVLFTALPVLSFGLLAWVSMLRLALVRKRGVDWVLLGADVAVVVLGFALTAAADGDTSSWQSNAGAVVILLCMGATAVYFLVVDIRVAQRAAAPWAGPGPAGYGAPSPYPPGFGGGPAPLPGAPRAGMAGPVPGVPRGGVPGGVPGAPGAGGPMGVGGPGGPGRVTGVGPAVPPPRINQVRAELDELSDYLRKQEDR